MTIAFLFETPVVRRQVASSAMISLASTTELIRGLPLTTEKLLESCANRRAWKGCDRGSRKHGVRRESGWSSGEC